MAAIPEAGGIPLKDEIAPPIIHPDLVGNAIASDIPLVINAVAVGGKDIRDEDIQAGFYDDEAAGGIGTAEGIVGYQGDRVGARIAKIYRGIRIRRSSSIPEVPGEAGSPLRLIGEGNLSFWLALGNLGGSESGLRAGMRRDGGPDGVCAPIRTDYDHPEGIISSLRVSMGGTSRPTYRIYPSIPPEPDRLANDSAIRVGSIFRLDGQRNAAFGKWEVPRRDGPPGNRNLLSHRSRAETIMAKRRESNRISPRSRIDMLRAGLGAGIPIAEVPRVDIAILAQVDKLDGLIFADSG